MSYLDTTTREDAIRVDFDGYTMSGAHRCLYRYLDIIDEQSVRGISLQTHGAEVVYGRGNCFNSCLVHPNLVKWVLTEAVESERLFWFRHENQKPWVWQQRILNDYARRV